MRVLKIRDYKVFLREGHRDWDGSWEIRFDAYLWSKKVTDRNTLSSIYCDIADKLAKEERAERELNEQERYYYDEMA